MNFQFFVEKLQRLDNYKEFISKNPGIFPCSAFFVIDKEKKGSEEDKQHFDFYIPSAKKMFSFQLENGGELVSVELVEGEKVSSEVSLKMDFEFGEIERLIEKKMEEEKIKSKVQRYLFSFQKKDGKHFLIGTVFISGLGILKVSIDLEKMEIIDFGKKSFFEILNIKKSGKKDKSS